MGDGTLLAAEKLTAGYGGVPVVRNLDLHVDAGEVVALLGPNGAGKSTTILTLAGDLAPLGGAVRLAGVRTTAPLHSRARRGLALVPEERSVLMKLTVRENLRLSRCEIGVVLGLFPEIEPLLARRCGLLSGGEQQMVSLACALARRPRILLADAFTRASSACRHQAASSCAASSGSGRCRCPARRAARA